VDASIPEPSLPALLAQVEARLHQHIAETRAYVDGGLAATREQIVAASAETRAYIDGGLAGERRHGDEREAETRRYIGVLAESLMTKIELVAEGVRANGEQLERFRTGAQEEFARVDRRLLRLAARRPRRRR
jgi:hypothetical protein